MRALVGELLISSSRFKTSKVFLLCSKCSTGTATLLKQEPNRDSYLKRGRQIVLVSLQTQTTRKFILSMGRLRQAKDLRCSTKRTSRQEAVWWWANKRRWITTSSRVEPLKTRARKTTTRVLGSSGADLRASTSFSAILKAPQIQMEFILKLLLITPKTFKLRFRMAKNSQV